MTAKPADADDVDARLSLLALDAIGPSRLRWLTESTEPARVVEHLRQRRIPPRCGPAPPGVVPDVVDKWFNTISSIDGPALREAELANGHGILTPHDEHWPFHLDPEPPALLFYRGDPNLLSVLAVGVVGTRRCTTVGRTVAHQLGFDLARAGVGVISGLALGVDAAAHQGALDGGGAAIGVVASGLDVVYPSSNRKLWGEVAGHGLLISEALAGTRPERWRFPARNRLIAALSSGVVIVESHGRGGSLITADEAADRGKPVFAVPGSVCNPAADGSNGLIIDGAIPVRSAADLLHTIGPARVDGAEPLARPATLGHRAPLDDDTAGLPPDESRRAADRVGNTDDADGGDDGAIEPRRSRVVGRDVVEGRDPDDVRGFGDGDDLCRRIQAEIAGGPCPIDHLVLSLKSSLTELLAATYLLVASGNAVFDGGTVAPVPASSTPSRPC